jgi:hypothetical protein
VSRYFYTRKQMNCQVRQKKAFAGAASGPDGASADLPSGWRSDILRPEPKAPDSRVRGRLDAPSERGTSAVKVVKPASERAGRRRPRFADLPGVLRALLQEVARGAIIYVPRQSAPSADDRLLAQYLYYRWIAGFKHDLAVAEAAAEAGLSVDTVSRRLREIRRSRAEATLHRGRDFARPKMMKP